MPRNQESGRYGISIVSALGSPRSVHDSLAARQSLSMNSSRRSRCVLLYSGGFDSTLAAILLAQEKIELIALSVDYSGRPRGERAAAHNLVPLLPFVDTVEVTVSDGPMVHSGENAYEGWIPFRNLLFWSIAAHKAILFDAHAIAAGHTTSDGRVYTDASQHFFRQLRKMMRFSGRIGIRAPLLVRLPLHTVEDKALMPIISEHYDLLRQSWSCWRNDITPCNCCFACKERSIHDSKIERYMKSEGQF